MEETLATMRRPVSLRPAGGPHWNPCFAWGSGEQSAEFLSVLVVVFVLQKRGRPPKPREEYHAYFEEGEDAEGLAPPQSKRKRAASAAAAASLEDLTLIGQPPPSILLPLFFSELGGVPSI
jgi:hypothetical protein